MALPQEVVIVYDGDEIQADVMPSGTRFESLMNALPGSAEVLVRDRNQVYNFVTGREITCTIDGVLLWGGYVTAARRKFAFPAVDTVTRLPSEVEERQWVLTCVDFNILFDRRVIRNTSNYLSQLPQFTSEDFDGAIIRGALTASLYIDVPSGFDVTTEVDDTTNFRVHNTLTNGAITSGSGTVTLDDVTFEFGGGIAANYPYFAVIKDDPVTGGNREVVKVTGRTGNVLDIERGQDEILPPHNPTSAVAHGDNSFFMHLTPAEYPQQGSPWRQLMADFALFGAVYYISPDKTVHFHSIETTEARWGFSDVPNKDTITASPVSFQGATYGFRDLDASEDGSPIINDALIWGGSEWSGEGQTVFARRQNQDSIDEHNRWQLAETHFGETGFKLQAGVDARAKVIVDGAPDGPFTDPRGLKYPQWDISLSWWAKEVPYVSGSPDHLRAGQLVTIQLQTFDDLELVLPLRRLGISFPLNADDPDKAWVKFEGSFSLQLSDPYTLWRYLLNLSQQGRGRLFSTVDGSNPAPYGSLFSGEPTPATDSTTTLFYLPDNRGYIAGTTEVYISPGNLLRRGTDYTESSPENGEISLVDAPDGSEWLWIVCRTL